MNNVLTLPVRRYLVPTPSTKGSLILGGGGGGAGYIFLLMQNFFFLKFFGAIFFFFLLQGRIFFTQTKRMGYFVWRNVSVLEGVLGAARYICNDRRSLQIQLGVWGAPGAPQQRLGGDPGGEAPLKL